MSSLEAVSHRAESLVVAGDRRACRPGLNRRGEVRALADAIRLPNPMIRETGRPVERFCPLWPDIRP